MPMLSCQNSHHFCVNSRKKMALKICLALCTYNGANFLEEQLASLASQTRKPDLLVVSDDASDDETLHILESFSQSSPFPVKIYVNPTNLGYVKNFEKAIKLCHGNIIALVDQDDVWLPEKLEKVVNVFERDRSINLIFSDAEVVDSTLSSLGYSLWESIGFDRQKQSIFQQGNAFELLLRRNYVTGATMAFRSEYRDILLPFPKDWGHDGWIAALMSVIGKIYPIQEKLILYRQHQENIIGGQTQSFSEMLSIARKRGRQNYQRRYRKHKILSERLKLNDYFKIDLKTMLLLENKIQHSFRLYNLPENKFLRIAPVFQEFSLGNYHRYGNGFQSLLEDLFVI